MNTSDVRDLLLFASALWPRTFVLPQDEDDLGIIERVWVRVLADLDTELLEAAMVGWEDHWPPTPHELRSAALGLRATALGEPQAPDVDEAWLEFKANYRTRGPWSHPAVEAAAEAIGCKEFGMSLESEEMAWRAHFAKFYDASATRSRRETEVAPPAIAAYMANVLKRIPAGELDA